MVNAPSAAASSNGDTSQRVLPDLSHHINAATAARAANMLKKMYPYLEMPSMVSLGGGLPHPSTFPILKASFELPTPPNFDGSPFVHPVATENKSENSVNGHAESANGQEQPHSHTHHHHHHHHKHRHGKKPAVPGKTIMHMHKGPQPCGTRSALDLAQAQQYARPMGFQPLVEALYRLTALLHNPPYEFAQIPTGGNTDASTKVFRALLDENDTLLVEDFEFAPPMAAARALGAGVKGVQIDTLGIVPEALDDLLSTWDTTVRGKKPHVLYTVPTGQNPSSATLTLERASAVYAVAQKHDLIIVEDDPYYWLVLSPYDGPANAGSESSTLEAGRVALQDVRDLDSFARSLSRSYLSLDTDGRVLRLDSFSKCFAPGMRIGWLTGSPAFIERLQRIAETDSQEVNGIAQAFFAQLLSEPHLNTTNESWGLEGFARWICDIRRQYSTKRDRLLNGVSKHCSKDHVRCKPCPQSGMFAWLEINLERHSEFRINERETRGKSTGPRTNAVELMERLFDLCIEENVLILQSSMFAASPSLPLALKNPSAEAVAIIEEERAILSDRSVFMRACFAGNLEQLDLAAARLGKAVERFFGGQER